MKKNVYVKPFHDIGEKIREDSELEQISRTVYNGIRPVIFNNIEVAFKKYAKAHKVEDAAAELEWQRFKKILSQML